VLDDFPIPVEHKPVSLKELDGWRNRVTQATTTVEASNEEEDGEISSVANTDKTKQQQSTYGTFLKASSKGTAKKLIHPQPWDPTTQTGATTIKAAKPKPKPKPEFSTLTSPTVDSFGSDQEKVGERRTSNE
jgi:hypothetical protein